ncbi:pyridoxine 5'-phosphate synthase [Candidatus Kinetoplastidibacterium crithidiae]|uniref:Pyridoxine 5'-phosphate synthase n=1 Tax=Candidatus Kinetoplastidibacterium crithidiae TCC036E TaxID=1208918 RepID=M1M5N4_9PROT|nr:pyridoxine 5'-phosphate synthase [Candidatus Kinetoplastibacterium crithidii]AFZ82459.1 pyridoxine 5'-phosphate synthase [Candidatus Kinetoplastibacterium crithidii (ex Angomonas deanei ATCC 30255)]AGF47470.1 pyridoxine 5-phosphate synthase [Candidatus Kinetoplastibacterium crithidii TCC036E]
MIELGVNIDHVATLRQQRHTCYPDPLAAALTAEKAGADLITLHLREDRRHIQDQDVFNISQNIIGKMNLECAITKEMLGIAVKARPDIVCLVPEKRQELTTEGGLDIINSYEVVSNAVKYLQSNGVKVSIFIDPDINQIYEAKQIGADAIELHTGRYAECSHSNEKDKEIDRLKNSVDAALKLGLKVNAGHGLHYDNIRSVLMINGISEFNIGHSIISRAVFDGLFSAVKEMKDLINNINID